MAQAKRRNPPIWSSKTDPVIEPGPAGTGLHRTRSGRLIDYLGNYVSDSIPSSRDATGPESFGPQPLRKPEPASTFSATSALTGDPALAAGAASHPKRTGLPVPLGVPAAVSGVLPNRFTRAAAAASAPAPTPAPAPGRAPAAATSANPLEQLLSQVLGGLGAYKPPSQADLLAQAGKLADASLAPYRAEIERQQQQAQADAERRAQLQSGFSSATADLLANIGPQTQSAYQAAGADQSTFAKGFSDAMRTIAQNDAGQQNKLLDQIGAPAGQLLDPGKAAAAGDVAYGLGGYIPASTFGREGAAFTAAANQLPATAAGQGSYLAANELAAGAKAKSDLGQKLLDLELQRPKATQDALAQLQTAAAQSQANAQNAALLPVLLAQKFEGFPGTNPLTGAPTRTQVGIDIQVGNQKIRLKQLDLTSRKTLAALTGFDPTTGAPTPETQRLLLAEWKAKNSAAKGGFTAEQLSEKRSKAGAIAHDAFYGVQGDATHDPLPPLTYQDAMREILNEGVPLSVAQQALNSYWTRAGADRTWEKTGDGFTVTGWQRSSAGRPRTPYQLRVRAAKGQ